MIKHTRIAEILHDAATDVALRTKGEVDAYEEFILDVSPDEDIEKVYTYIQNERRLAEMTKEEYPSYDEYMIARGRLDAYDKIEKALVKYGE